MKMAYAKYYWTFFFVLIIFLVLLVLNYHVLFVVLFCLCLLRIFTVNKKLGYLALILVFFFSIRLFHLQQNLAMRQELLGQADSTHITLLIEPEMIKSEATYLNGQAKVIVNNQTIPVSLQVFDEAVLKEFQERPVHQVEKIQVSGEIKEIEGAMNFHVFDYKAYLAKKGIYHQIEVKEIISRQPDRHLISSIKNMIFKLKAI